MRKVVSKPGKTRSLDKLPEIAHRLMEANRQKQSKFKQTGLNFRGSLTETIPYLRWKANCGTVLDALSYIADEIERERIYVLYRRLFPNEWQNSKASFNKIGFNEYHTEREFEFINLISSNYFPIETWLDWSDYRFDHIPIESVNFDFCCGEFDWENFRPCLRFGVAAFLNRGGGFYDAEWNEILSTFNLQLEQLPPISHSHPPYQVLEKQRHNPKIDRFLHLIEFIHHDTENPFIDTTCCQPMDLYAWTHENLEKLKTEYRGVQAYFDSLDSLDADIERNARKTFRELISLWNTGKLPNQRRKEAADTRENTAGLLINILADAENAAIAI